MSNTQEFTEEKEEMVDLHVKVTKNQMQKINLIRYYSGRSKGFIIRKAIEDIREIDPTSI